ncbi:MAG: dethiobiotin synthase [Xanthomonadales bacterium]|nr:dethiobiotin synthase [Xanthomonadales bacterium]
MDPVSVFITGTDTGVGKTHVSSALLLAVRRRALKAFGYKPVASGCLRRGEEWVSEDAERLRAYSTTPTPDLALMNPYALPEPIAPHLAAAHAGRTIELPPLLAAHQALALGAHAIVVEGAGGWAIPYSDHLMQADLVRALKLPVILVVGIRLGCINHAILSEIAIRADRCELLGWVANRVDPDCRFPDEVVATLREELDAPLLADCAFGANIDLATAPFAPLLDRLGLKRAL